MVPGIRAVLLAVIHRAADHQEWKVPAMEAVSQAVIHQAADHQEWKVLGIRADFQAVIHQAGDHQEWKVPGIRADFQAVIHRAADHREWKVPGIRVASHLRGDRVAGLRVLILMDRPGDKVPSKKHPVEATSKASFMMEVAHLQE